MIKSKFNWDAVSKKLNEQKTSGSKPIDDLVPHNAKLVGMVFTGPETISFKGEEKTKDNLILIFALESGRVYSTKVAISFHEKSKLYKYLTGWNQPCELGPNLLDQNALLFFENKQGTNKNGETKTYTNLTRVAPAKKEVELKEPVQCPQWILNSYGEENIAAGEFLTTEVVV